MEPLLGWWLFDAERSAIVHATTGQSIRYRGGPSDQERSGLDGSGNRRWIRFDYEDGATRYPILIEWRNVPTPASGRPLVWRVDHIRSALLWHGQTGSNSTFPPFDLWQRVDDCLTDALPCWPSHMSSGLKPAFVALNGGWLNGAWTPDYFRSVTGSVRLVTSTEAYQAFVPPAPDEAASGPWRQAEPTFAPPPWVQRLPVEVRSEVAAAIARGPCLRSEDGRRILLGLPAGGDGKFPASLLYADDDVVTDFLCPTIGIHHGTPTLNVGQARSYLLLDRVTGTPLRQVPHTTVLPNGQTLETHHPPYWVSRRLVRACLDGLLCHPDMRWAPPVRRHDGQDISMPRQINVRIELGGAASPSRLETVRSLMDSPRDQRNTLACFFDEVDDGIVRGAAPFRTLGFWRYDPAGRCLINDLSGQRVVHVEPPADAAPASASERVWQFHYEDREVWYPLVVVPRSTATNGRSTYAWCVDHARSANLWRAATGDASPPPYGLWRRVDDCIIDALLCWPEIEATGQVPSEVVSMAGWHNGMWSPNFRQSRRHGPEFGFADKEPVAPFVEDLTALPLSWRYVDTDHVARAADLAGVREVMPGLYHLPAEQQLTGFERDMPHLRRGDDRAVMFPADLDSILFRGEDYQPCASFLYADAEIFFRIDGQASSAWSFETRRLTHIGLRHAGRLDMQNLADLPGDWFRRTQTRAGTDIAAVPSPRLWQRLRIALTDGWLAWTGNTGRLLDDPDKMAHLRDQHAWGVPTWEGSGISLGRKSTVRVAGAYIGGRFHNSAQSAAWLEDPI